MTAEGAGQEGEAEGRKTCGRRAANVAATILGRTLQERLVTFRRLLWIVAVGVCCFFMVIQVGERLFFVMP